MSNTAVLFSGIKLPRRAKGRGELGSVREWFPVTDWSVVLALDPSIVNIGWAIVRKIDRNRCERIDSGNWRPAAKGDANRFNVLADLVRDRIALWRHTANEITDAVIELPNKGPTWKGMSTDDVRANSRAIGAIEAACYLAGVTVNLVRVAEWKGSTKKDYTHTVVKAIFGYDAQDHNECDALGLGAWICGR